MRPVSIRQPAVIIEVKIAKEAKDLETDAEVALKQIEEKNMTMNLSVRVIAR